jgi:F-type H+-transporting ATPase subunit b
VADQLLRFEPGLMIWTIIVFLFTLAALSKIAWGPLMKALDDREKRIHDALTKAEQAQRAAEEAITRAKSDSDAALRQADELIKDARVEAQQLRQKMVDEAKAESQKTVEQGLNRIAAEQRIAMAEIRRTAADLAVRAAAQLMKSSMSEQQQRQIVEDFLGDLPDPSAKTVQ